MMLQNKTWMRVALMVSVALATFSCSNEFNQNTSPVDLIVTNTQVIQHFDFAPGAANCNQDVGTINIEARLKALNSNADQRFNDVRITRYRVSYVRTDGGTQVPAPFVRSIDTLVSAGGGTTPLGKFLLATSDAFSQAPFAALQTTGRDPETGRPVVRLDIVVELFGQTLAGENVTGSTRFPIDFCFQCGGCG